MPPSPNEPRRDAAPASSGPSDLAALFVALTNVRAMFASNYPDFDWYLVGRPRRAGVQPIRILCPEPNTQPPPPEDGSNADLIQQVLEEADRPLTILELAFRATNGEPTGAFRRALKKMVASGEVTEIPGPPRTYEA